MGIPHLITYLERYSTLESLSGECVVIDGPAFAYHVYYLCLLSRSHLRRPFEAAPSYAEMGEAALQWLGGLERANVTMYHTGSLPSKAYATTANLATSKKIYFDGFLPASKLDTRLGRLISTTRRMSDFYYSNQKVHVPVSRTRTTTSLFNQSSLPSRLSTLPPIPFHVPAVIEALRESSRYKSITYVVPGEADLYCSRYLSHNGGIVLTGDSDLLVHSLGPMGKVTFLKDIRAFDLDSEVLQGQIYWPSSIAQELALPVSHGLLSLAFEMTMDPYVPFSNHVANAKKLKSLQAEKSMFEEFQKEYEVLIKELPSASSPDTGVDLLQGLDPRISEYILQYPSLAELSGQDMDSSSSAITHIFLPFLLDTPEQTSAWEMSTSVRQLSYGLINLVVPHDQQKMTVHEHKKQKDKSQGRELALPGVSEISEACSFMVKLLRQLREAFPKISDEDLWTTVAVYQDIEWAHAHSKKALSVAARHQIHSDDFDETSAWDLIQFFAEIQASYYSFRIMKQIMSLVIPYSAESLPEPMVALHEQLGTLPTLAQLQSLNQVASIMKLVESVIPVVYNLLGLESEGLLVASKESKRVAKKTRKRERDAALKSPPMSNNPFDILNM